MISRWCFFEESGMSNRSAMLVRLLLVTCFVCRSGEKFQRVRRLKTWLRSTMTQVRLNSLAVCHIHQEVIDVIDVVMLINEFVSNRCVHDCILSYHVGQSCVNISIICPFPITY